MTSSPDVVSQRRSRFCSSGPPRSSLTPPASEFTDCQPVGVACATNRRIEREVRALGGLKSLYSDAYYPRDEFDELYGGPAYRTVKATYDPDSRFLDLYAKAVQRR